MQQAYGTEEDRIREKRQFIFSILKIIIFAIIWATFTLFLLITPPFEPFEIVVPLKSNEVFTVLLNDQEPHASYIRIEIYGNIDAGKTNYPSLASENDPRVEVAVEFYDTSLKENIWKSEIWQVYTDKKPDRVLKYIEVDQSMRITSDNIFGSKFNPLIEFRVTFLNLQNEADGFSIRISPNPLNRNTGVWLGFFLIFLLYILIAFEISDRTFSALLTSTLALGFLGAMNDRPSMGEIISWMNMSTIMLLFAMMILVAILGDTGFFEYIAVVLYGWSGGETWRLLSYLCLFTSIVTAFLDNVTIVLLIVPITIRISEIMDLETKTVLIIIVMFANIGGALTPVGDPPNVLISTNHYVVAHNIYFSGFTLHMFPGVLLSEIAAMLLIYFMFKDKLISQGKSLENALEILENNKRIGEDKRRMLIKRLIELQELQKTRAASGSSIANFEEVLKDMKEKNKIRDKPLLVMCGVAITFLICMFFMHSLPLMVGVTIEWAAILAALLLLIMDNRKDVDSILDRVEWTTLIFIASLFVLLEALNKMGLVHFLNDIVSSLVGSVGKNNQLIVSMMFILWVTAFLAALVDNVPTTTIMLRLTTHLAATITLNLPLSPMVWSLVFGACFGANATLIGSGANILMTATAYQYGYKITYKQFAFIGVPIMLLTVTVAFIYLFIAHYIFSWHDPDPQYMQLEPEV